MSNKENVSANRPSSTVAMVLFSLLVLTIMLALLRLCVGEMTTGFGWPTGNAWDAIVRIFFGDIVADPPAMSILDIRLQRVIQAILVGVSLALGGVALQGLLRNPLAEPFILGLSSGAAVGVMAQLLIVYHIGRQIGGGHVGALVGSLLSMGIVYAAGRRRGVIDPLGLLLVGVVLGTINGAVIMILNFVPGPAGLNENLAKWMMGFIDEKVSSSTLLTITLGVIICLILLIWLSRAMDAAAFSESEAASLGVNLPRLRVVLFVVAGLLAASAVVLAGPIAFVGLICPHLVRLMIGPTHRPLLIGSALTGAGLILLADTASVIIDINYHTGRLPIGIFTAIVGGIAFLYMLRPHLGRGMD